MNLLLREHPAIGDVGVVRNGKDVDALLGALDLEIGPEVLRQHRVEGGERSRRRLVLEEHVAVHVRAVRDRGPFIGVERGELARIVVRVRRLDEPLPHALAKLGRDVFRQWLGVLHEGLYQLLNGRAGFRRVFDARDDGLREVRLGEIALRVLELLQDAVIFRVIRDRDEIIRRPALHRLAGCGELDLLALGEVVGVVPGSADADA